MKAPVYLEERMTIDVYVHEPHRTALAIDAAGCALMGLVVVVFAEPVAQALSLPAPVLRGAGLLLLPVAVLNAGAFRATAVSQPLLWLIVIGNVLWVGASVVLLVSGLVEPNVLGAAVVLAQAVSVAAMTALEATGLRRRSAAPQ